MKKNVFFLLLLLSNVGAYSQKINYQKNYNEALDKAAKAKKLLFVAINVTPQSIPGHPELDVATHKSALNNPDVVSFYNEHFVSFSALRTDSSSVALLKKYPANTFPVYFFIDARGNAVYKATSNSNYSEKYLKMGQSALNMQASGKTLTAYLDQYALGNRSVQFLKEYITLRKDLGLYDNAKLIDEYVDQLTIKSLQNYQEILFILEAGPIAYGKAYSIAYTNRHLVDSIYKTEPLALRVEINNHITQNTMIEAIKRKDQKLALQASGFSAGTWNNNYRQGYITSQARMLDYYRAVKDTASYLRQAAIYFDANYMNISADSSKKVDQHRMDVLRQKMVAGDLLNSDTTKRRVIRFKPSTSISSANIVALTLNNAAYEFYNLGTHNQTYLSKALLWSKRSLELEEKPSYYDTLAHLLYRMGFYDEAISTQNKAVKMAEDSTHKTDAERYKKELSKIKARQLPL